MRFQWILPAGLAIVVRAGDILGEQLLFSSNATLSTPPFDISGIYNFELTAHERRHDLLRRDACPTGLSSCTDSPNICCPVGGQCCTDGNCCPAGNDCVFLNKKTNSTTGQPQVGCCPTGTVCPDAALTCTNTNWNLCPGETFCCPHDYTCYRDSANIGKCHYPGAPGLPPDTVIGLCVMGVGIVCAAIGITIYLKKRQKTPPHPQMQSFQAGPGPV